MESHIILGLNGEPWLARQLGGLSELRLTHLLNQCHIVPLFPSSF